MSTEEYKGRIHYNYTMSQKVKGVTGRGGRAERNTVVTKSNKLG